MSEHYPSVHINTELIVQVFNAPGLSALSFFSLGKNMVDKAADAAAVRQHLCRSNQWPRMRGCTGVSGGEGFSAAA